MTPYQMEVKKEMLQSTELRNNEASHKNQFVEKAKKMYILKFIASKLTSTNKIHRNFP